MYEQVDVSGRRCVSIICNDSASSVIPTLRGLTTVVVGASIIKASRQDKRVAYGLIK